MLKTEEYKNFIIEISKRKILTGFLYGVRATDKNSGKSFFREGVAGSKEQVLNAIKEDIEKYRSMETSNVPMYHVEGSIVNGASAKWNNASEDYEVSVKSQKSLAEEMNKSIEKLKQIAENKLVISDWEWDDDPDEAHDELVTASLSFKSRGYNISKKVADELKKYVENEIRNGQINIEVQK